MIILNSRISLFSFCLGGPSAGESEELKSLTITVSWSVGILDGIAFLL